MSWKRLQKNEADHSAHVSLFVHFSLAYSEQIISNYPKLSKRWKPQMLTGKVTVSRIKLHCKHGVSGGAYDIC